LKLSVCCKGLEIQKLKDLIKEIEEKSDAKLIRLKDENAVLIADKQALGVELQNKVCFFNLIISACTLFC